MECNFMDDMYIGSPWRTGIRWHQSCTDKGEELDDGSNGSWRGVSGRPGGGIRGAKSRAGRDVPRDGSRPGDKTSDKTVVAAAVFTSEIEVLF
jgi:hypothetical protein